MSETIGYQQVCGMLNAATDQIRRNHEMLSKLDSAVGDGDHGTTILRAMEAVSKTVSESAGSDLKALFSAIAWAVMSCDGGSTGPLLGSLFMGMSDGAAGRKELDYAGLVSVFEAGITKLQKQSRAQVGDKTMMDAFLPALAALKVADGGRGIKAALDQAAEAAAKGAEATKSMKAKFGRARNLGDRVLGHADPGAVSVSLLFKGFSEGI
ncbi:MAG: dihydroxyacetone kinase subunit DhaL [Verrucomicrobia bacterium]|nr:dihydroxyacetone kinase subunit DhaL [Verrucomicrobiota bacterium]